MQGEHHSSFEIVIGVVCGMIKYIYLYVIYAESLARIVEPVGTAFLCGAGAFAGRKAIEWILASIKEFKAKRKLKK